MDLLIWHHFLAGYSTVLAHYSIIKRIYCFEYTKEGMKKQVKPQNNPQKYCAIITHFENYRFVEDTPESQNSSLIR